MECTSTFWYQILNMAALEKYFYPMKTGISIRVKARVHDLILVIGEPDEEIRQT